MFPLITCLPVSLVHTPLPSAYKLSSSHCSSLVSHVIFLATLVDFLSSSLWFSFCLPPEYTLWTTCLNFVHCLPAYTTYDCLPELQIAPLKC
ncbi:hypothetical protein ILYODFUR_003053 [Ilyodon furcidens]|uniref:Uncharacterized protein n=1 Tax=Ilyodon furcidens TaxID=33524 RepID=A0ABV0V0N7_9TELE